MTRPATILLSIVVLFTLAGAAHAQTARDAFNTGEAALAKGDLNAALTAFATAARADRTNPAYMQHYALVRRAIEMQQALKSETDPQRWEYLARGLHAFYANEGLYAEALPVDQQLHARLGTSETAFILAETQMALSQNAAAAETLSKLPPERATSATRAMLGVALARDGKKDEAKKLAPNVALPETPHPGVAYAVARYYGAVGDGPKAAAALKESFAAMPPSQLDGLKAHAKVCLDFASLSSTDEFADALKTASKVSESKCSGGSSCAGCPMRGKCSGGR